MESAISLLIFIGILAGITWRIRFLGRALGRTRAPAAPTLTDVLAGEPDDPSALPESAFRQAHALQAIIYLAAAGILLVAFVWSLAAHGWSVLGILLGAAELLLLFLHGAPLVVNISRTLRVTTQGIETKGLLKHRSIYWWEMQSFEVAGDLSRFRARGATHAVEFDTTSFSSESKLAMYRAIRAHLVAHQYAISPLPEGTPAIRLLKSSAVSIGIFLVIALAAVISAEKFLPEPEGNVLGLRCAYASNYLQEKYTLPEHHGCVVIRVNAGSAADRAGLRVGDMIVGLEGIPITSGTQFSLIFDALHEREQQYEIVRPGKNEPHTVTVKLDPVGQQPKYLKDDPYSAYLRARDSADAEQAIADYGQAIALAPDFDLAYVYRASLYIDESELDLAAQDLEHALQLDPDLTEAYRERIRYQLARAQWRAAVEDGLKAAQLDGCEGSFGTYNYDCHRDHFLLGYAYGENAGSDELKSAVEEVKQAIFFYPAEPRSYYLAALYLSAQDDFKQARQFAQTYLDKGRSAREPDSFIRWAERLVSGQPLPDSEPDAGQAAVFVEASGDVGPSSGADPVLTYLTFAAQRTADRPPPADYMSIGRTELWAYLEFSNAGSVRDISWQWVQNGFAHSTGAQPWPGTNEGHVWLRLENAFAASVSRGKLAVIFDDRLMVEAPLIMRDEPYVSPLTFFTDPGATETVVFYAGGPLFAELKYEAMPPDGRLSWVAMKDGARVGEGVFDAPGVGHTLVPVALAPGTAPGLVEVAVYLDDSRLLRHAAIVIVASETVVTSPFRSFQTGIDLDGDHLMQVRKEFMAFDRGSNFVVSGISLPPDSRLSFIWTKDGSPFPTVPDGLQGDILPWVFVGSFEVEEGIIAAGEYPVVISLNDTPIFADVIVVEAAP